MRNPDRRPLVNHDERVPIGAEQLGGGGHKCASGCAVDGPLAVAVARVIAQLRVPPSVQ